MAAGVGGRGEGAVRGFGIHVYTPPYLKWVTDKDLLTGKHRELCSKLRGLLDGKGAWGRVDTCVCLSSCVVHLKLSQYCFQLDPSTK